MYTPAIRNMNVLCMYLFIECCLIVFHRLCLHSPVQLLIGSQSVCKITDSSSEWNNTASTTGP